MPETTEKTVFERIYQVVGRIPPGQVATYGQIARIVGGCNPRVVGYAMAGAPPDRSVPWHRVINSQGRISMRRDGAEDARQKRLLRAEGIIPGKTGRYDLNRYLWDGPGWSWCRENGFHGMPD